MSPLAANRSPEYHGSEPEPLANAPPWIQTSTGRFLESAAGVQMLRVRKSSDCGRSKSPITWASRERPCGGIGPSLVASRVLCHEGTGCGGEKRSSPVGGDA